MPTINCYDQVTSLWLEWHDGLALKPHDSSLKVLSKILERNGNIISSQEISFIFACDEQAAQVDKARFTDCIVALLGNKDLRLKHAFEAFNPDTTGSISKFDLLKVVISFTGDDVVSRLLLDEIDADGDERVTIEDIIRYLQHLGDDSSNLYRATHLNHDHIASSFKASKVASIASKSKINSQHDEGAGMSPLQLRIGFFRLMQGAAYRSFRANYSANSETHLRARDLPYTIEDFADFTTAMIDFYLSLGIITDPRCVAEFFRLDKIVKDELDRLRDRIYTWPQVAKTPEMLAAQEKISFERDEKTERREIFQSVIEFVLSLRMHGIPLDQASTDALTEHELNRLRHTELRKEMHAVRPAHDEACHDIAYLKSWNRVIMTEADDQPDGAIMPARFWYEDFMPQLLRCASLMDAKDLQEMDEVTEQDLDAWHQDLLKQGAFDRFASDLGEAFPKCSKSVKLSLRQAWELTEPYLAGVEKRRERAEFGRDDGYLSEYVAFVDVYLGRNDIAKADMRLSFPYYIGPATWGFLHGSAELVEAMPEPDRIAATDRFVAFFRSFATMYPCPYCRYHLNRYVIRNREVAMYPMEFLLLGHKPDQRDTSITLDDKLATITAPGALRKFLWKLHNAVSSSIARTEPWYHRQPKPLYTTRFWPSMEAEIAHAAAGGVSSIALDRLKEIFSITKPTAHLAVLRDELAHALNGGDAATVAKIIDRADDAIADLERAMDETAYLTRKYAFDPDKMDKLAPVDEAQEAYARSGVFIER